MAPLCKKDANLAFYAEDEESTTTLSSSVLLSSTLEISALVMTPQTTRSVSFSAGAAVHFGAVINLGDYSDEEKCDCWYQPDEMREIRKELKETVAKMNKNMDDAKIDDTISIHGLEGKTKAGKRHRKETRLASLAAVFDEQALQEMDGLCDANVIAMAYAEYTQPMKVAAFQRALQHQKETADLYLDENSNDDDLSSPCTNDVFIEGCKRKQSHDLGKSEDVNDSPSSMSFKIASSESIIPQSIENFDNDETVIVDIDNGSNRQYNMGSFRIRDRFAWLAFQ